MSGKAILIVVLGIMSISYVTYETIMTRSNESSKTIGDFFYEQQAYNISQTGINICINRLEKEPKWRKGHFFKNLFGGKINTYLKDTLYQQDSVVKITSEGIMGYNTKDEYRVSSIAYLISQSTSVQFPQTIMGALTSNSAVSTNGNMVIDGRDHDLNGNLLNGNGSYGIWTTGTYSQSGSSTVGSSIKGKDYVPSTNINDNVRLQKQNWKIDDVGKTDAQKLEMTNFPATPELALGGSAAGFTANKLKEIAQSGKDGSQYVTDPSKLSNNQLAGVTYIELGNNQSWQPKDITGTGILIVHNSNGNALLKNINKGTFKGIVISDDIDKVHTSIIGAVFTLTSKKSGSVIGNGNGGIYYSSEAVKNALANYAVKSASNSSGKKGVVAYWN